MILKTHKIHLVTLYKKNHSIEFMTDYIMQK